MSMKWSPDYLGSPGKMVLSNPLTCTNTPKGENKLYSDAKGVVPSLDLRFAEGKNLNDYMTGTPLVDHQRSMSGSNLSPGTFVNSSGLIETAKVNLIVYSEDFSVSSAWVAAGATSVQSTTVLAPDNLSFTYKLEEDNTTGSHRFLSGASNTVSATINLPYTISFFVKNAGRDYVFIRFNTGVGDFVTGSVRLSDATVTQTITGTITATPVGNGWVRIVGTGVSNATGSAYPEIRASNSAIYSNYTGDGTSGIYVWGAQVEEGTTATTTYIPTTTVPSAAPRFDHDPTTGESLGLLIEESRTNLMLDSGTTAQMITVNQTNRTSGGFLAPDGSTDASRVDTPEVSNLNIVQVVTEQFLGLPINTNHTASVYLKGAVGGELVWLTFDQGVPQSSVAANLTTEWQRFDVTASTGNGTLYFNVGVDTRTGTGQTTRPAQSFYIWGAQVEVGSFPTSYIPTTGTALTRSADAASITGSNFSSWYNQSEGSVYFKGGPRLAIPAPNNSYLLTFAGFSANSDQMVLYQNFFFQSVVSTRKLGVFGPSAAISPAGAGVSDNAFGYSLNSVSYSRNTDFQTGTNANPISTAIIKLDLGLLNSASYLNGHISRLTYWPERLPDATLQAITAS